jgi:hypothetical protein
MVRHLLPGCIFVAVHGNGLDPESLQCDQHLFAEFAGAKKHHACG